MAPRHTLLVVDDEPDVVQSVQDLLRRQFRVLGATQADEGLRLLREQEVHVVMSDQRMPGTSGVEFLARVRAERPDVVRLLFTGYADLKAVIDAINEGHVTATSPSPGTPPSWRRSSARPASCTTSWPSASGCSLTCRPATRSCRRPTPS